MSAIRSKFDGATGVVKSKYAQQQTQAHGMGVKDRWRVARGDNVRWEETKRASNTDELGEEYSSGGAGVRHRLPPPPPGGGMGSSSRAPPPAPAPRPQAALTRTGATPPPARGGAPEPPPRSGAAAPPLPSSAKPRLPPRMNNEAGIDHPPPPYVPSHASNTPTASSIAPVRTLTPSQSLEDHEQAIAFSRFTYQDKRRFFALLDEFFASKGANVSTV